MPKHAYTFKTKNGRVSVLIDGYLFFSFNQIDFKGLYAYKDDTNLYGLDIYLASENAESVVIETSFKTKEVWLATLKLLDENM